MTGRIVARLTMLLRAVGGAVSLALAALGVGLLLQDRVPGGSLFNVCKRLSGSLVFAFAGFAGCYFEAWPPVSDGSDGKPQTYGSFASTATRKIMLAFFYFWVGCSVLGEVGGFVLPTGYWWKVAACTVGFMSWAVAAGRLGTACAEDGAVAGAAHCDEERHALAAPRQRYGEPV